MEVLSVIPIRISGFLRSFRFGKPISLDATFPLTVHHSLPRSPLDLVAYLNLQPQTLVPQNEQTFQIRKLNLVHACDSSIMDAESSKTSFSKAETLLLNWKTDAKSGSVDGGFVASVCWSGVVFDLVGGEKGMVFDCLVPPDGHEHPLEIDFCICVRNILRNLDIRCQFDE
ncbi:hypothetical protein Tco_0014490 [Tanacetum coccineum]